MRLTLSDGRQLVGTMKGFDRHMNVVLGDCDEFRIIKNRETKEEREEKRSLGFVLLRGEHLMLMTVEGRPPPEETAIRLPQATVPVNPGIAKMAGRGVPMTNPALQTAPRGVGLPAPSMMHPSAMRPPMMPPPFQQSLATRLPLNGQSVPRQMPPRMPPGPPGM
ncbi:small nuclear ribonucleoprotein-associated protein B-like [Octopus sinensis]|uniref:Sm protein B n=1 Tax=Octopus sinensis TaxID=2607531 RepID=A0A6P7U154_9MOLL|nr:small nuclear ribonucleoprotein-associated protein B-like [Octopus sinensis]XP_029656590.1 small nuclear ribonucleoprotein-associated protein B-like [Octopus sinensis]